jgi:hypothetical protein
MDLRVTLREGSTKAAFIDIAVVEVLGVCRDAIVDVEVRNCVRGGASE